MEQYIAPADSILFIMMSFAACADEHCAIPDLKVSVNTLAETLWLLILTVHYKQLDKLSCFDSFRVGLYQPLSKQTPFFTVGTLEGKGTYTYAYDWGEIVTFI